MNKLLLSVVLLADALTPVQAQKKVLGYPFQFEKAFLAKGQYSTYFLDNPVDSAFALILKDNKKAEYIWLGKDFKPLAKVSSPIENTLLDHQKHKYIGGTARGGEYHFIYQSGTELDMETVDFKGHTISDKKMLELPKSEKTVASFSDYNVYYCLTADDKAGNLVIYTVSSDGALTRREIALPVPLAKAKLSEYLKDLSVLKSTEDPEMSSAAHINKLFSRRSELLFLMNVRYPDIRTFSINTSDFTVKDNNFDVAAFLGLPTKGDITGAFSFAKDSILYSLGHDKKSIHIGIQRLSDGEMIAKYEFSDDGAFTSFAETPVRETRYIKEVDSKELDTWKKLFSAIRSNGLETCMVSLTRDGKILFTGGTFMPIATAGGADMPHYMGGFDHSSTTTYSNGMVVPNYNPYMYRLPGTPSFVGSGSSGTYYMSTYFRMLLDPATLKPVKGQPGRPVIEQIRDFVYAKGRLKASNQFAIGKNQYYGYYDEDAQEYVIEQIPIH
jgi:hypothetical protein